MPKPLKSEHQRFKITKFTNNSGSISYRVSGYLPSGKQIRKNFKSKFDANEYLITAEKEAEATGVPYALHRTTLSTDQLNDAEQAAKLAPGRSISKIVGHYLQLEKRVRRVVNIDLDEAVSYIEKHYKPNLEELTIREARQRFLESRREITPKTSKQYTWATKALLAKNPNKRVDSFQVHDIQKILDPYGNTNSALTYRRILNVFFNWAVRFHYCLENPCSRLDRVNRDIGHIEILSLESIKRLLSASMKLFEGQMTSSIAILLFAGLRPSELEDLEAKSIKGENIRVTGGKLRRKLKRSVPIPPALKAWLKAYPFKGIPAGWRYKFRKLKEASGADNWVQDILRHTSISYQLERDQDESGVAFRNGTSVSMINLHYREIIDDPEDVKAFWKLTPQVIEKVDLVIPEKKNQPIQWPTKAKLAKLVYEKPLSRLAKDLGCSDNAIRKHCLKQGIELPKNGYWQRKRAREF